jgi:glycosyltransferase involved in cell wall biosynthesis
MIKKNMVIALYSTPDYYPPTLSAIEYLSGEYDQIFVVFRNYKGTFDWVYPGNVKLIPTGNDIDIRQAEKSSTIKKIRFFIQYCIKFYSTIRRNQADTLLLYDFMPILAFRLLLPFIKMPRVIWYHNHDVADNSIIRKCSLAWFAWKSEAWIFPKLSIFSLPSMDRREFFPMGRLVGEFYFLPNFPSIKVFKRYSKSGDRNNDIIKIIYQGSISPWHGFEEIIGILDRSIHGKKLDLTLRGFITDDYRESLVQLAKKNGVSAQLAILPPISYSKVIEKTAHYNIGIGIYRREDIMNRTLGTSSNKIYEYAAAGLPVLLFDNTQFRSNLQKFKWAFFTDCSDHSLISALEKIELNLETLSCQAREDFETQLNFEKFFNPVCRFLKA